jgi:hypothetical protein
MAFFTRQLQKLVRREPLSNNSILQSERKYKQFQLAFGCSQNTLLFGIF